MGNGSSIRYAAVYLGSAETPVPEFRQAVIDLADYLAEHEITLVFGGSNTGMMKLLADRMLEKNGKVIGVFTRSLPEKLIRNDLTESIITQDLAERKKEMLRLADVIIALPGSFGTFDELFDALAQQKLKKESPCPVGVLNIKGFYDPLFALLQNSSDAGFSSARTLSLLKSGTTPEELFRNF